MGEIVLRLPPLHPNQARFINCGKKRTVGACGTKWGKTWGLSHKMTGLMWQNRQKMYWWVAPYGRQAKLGWRQIIKFLPKGTYRENKKEDYICIPHEDGDTYCYFLTADNPDSLLGEGVHHVIVDEAARMKEVAWENIQTTLTHTDGSADIISTPHGRTWFYREWLKGRINPQTGKTYEPDYKSFNLPTSDNPTIKREVIERRRRSMSEDMFREFYLAEFLDESAGCFTGMSGCWYPTLEPPLIGEQYVMGLDLGRKRDYTVCCVMNAENKNLVHFERFKGGTWRALEDRAMHIAAAYSARIYMDAHGVGDRVYENILERYPGRVIPIVTASNRAKADLIENLRVDIGNGDVHFPDRRELPELNAELESFEISPISSGRYRYEAPSGQHDDCVFALALAVWGCKYTTFRRTIGYDPGGSSVELYGSRHIQRLKMNRLQHG